MDRKMMALTNKRKIENAEFIFPEQLEEIPGICGFQDIKAICRHAKAQMEPYREGEVDLIVNGGLTMEVLAVLQAAAMLHISLKLWHFNRATEAYIPQEVRWHPAHAHVDDHPKMEKVRFSLCKNRHPGLPENYIYEIIPDDRVTDFLWQEERAGEVLKAYANQQVEIYLTGLTSLSISVLNVAVPLGISVVFFHYDYDIEDYFPQYMEEIVV